MYGYDLIFQFYYFFIDALYLKEWASARVPVYHLLLGALPLLDVRHQHPRIAEALAALLAPHGQVRAVVGARVLHELLLVGRAVLARGARELHLPVLTATILWRNKQNTRVTSTYKTLLKIFLLITRGFAPRQATLEKSYALLWTRCDLCKVS